MKYDKLITKLRTARTVSIAWEGLMNDAAAAIEALQALLKEADKKQAYQHDYICELVAEVEELKAQLPKRGKWIGVSPMVDTAQCSVCGGQLFSAELKTPYCQYCGAKMEVQDGQ